MPSFFMHPYRYLFRYRLGIFGRPGKEQMIACAGACLLVAVTSLEAGPFLPLAVMLFYPFLQRGWQMPRLWPGLTHTWPWLVLISLFFLLVFQEPGQARFAVASLAVVAIPEEWFFRAYMLRALGNGLPANVVTSLFFSAGHVAGFGWEVGLLVFPASLVFGWLYQRTGDWPLVVLLHAVSNLFYVIYLADSLRAALSL